MPNTSSLRVTFLVDFFPDGADERQFSSPGFNLPFGLLMRNMFDNMAIPEDFPEYRHATAH